MKKIIAFMMIATLLVTPVSAKEKREPSDEAYRVRCTCYLPTGNKCKGGVYPYEGVIATNDEHLGQTAALYTEDGKFIGYFESMDTGGHKDLKNGTRIDVYRKNMKRALKWVKKYGDYVLIEWVEAEDD